ncbi:MAG: HYExAFE family protein [Gemmata sp.]|jgi:Holliday junction resolvase
MKDDNHYEPAFDAFLREQGCAVVPVVEARRSYLEARAVKSPDFLAVAPGGAKLVVDVKGRKFPGSGPGGKPRNVWHSWCEREDAESLVKWAASFGDQFTGVLAFVYHLAPAVQLPAGVPDLFAFRGRRYLMRGVNARAYTARMRTRSPRWGTVHLAAADFRLVVKPITDFLAPAPTVVKSLP